MIKLNPLVTDVKLVDAPRDAAADEYYSSWYEINQVITWGFGLKKKISFRGCFHDQPWGLQSHVYAPMGVDLRNKYKIGGNQPGEPREARELGVNTPQDGLYLREDHEIVCAVPLTASFVKKEMQSATAIMIDRLTRKAELLEEGKLHALFEDGKLKTAKPSNAATFNERDLPSPGFPSPSMNSANSNSDTFSPSVDAKGYGRYQDVARVNSQRHSTGYVPGYNGPDQRKYGADLPGVTEINELPGSYYHNDSPGMYPAPLKSSQGPSFRSELPGDMTYIGQPPQAPDSKPAYPGYGQQYPASAPAHQTSFAQPQPSPQPSLQSFNSQQTPPNPPYPTQQQPSPQPQRHSTSSGYQIANPDRPLLHPAHRTSSNTGEQWQQGLAINHDQDPNSLRGSQYSQQSQQSHQDPNSLRASQYSQQSQQSRQDPNSLQYPQQDPRNSQYSQQSQPIEPDAQRFSQMSMQPDAPGGKLSRPGTKCPVCGLFEGDATAVSHHVSKAHFT